MITLSGLTIEVVIGLKMNELKATPATVRPLTNPFYSGSHCHPQNNGIMKMAPAPTT